MEEINEIIARSQVRAQQLLASGTIGIDSMKNTVREGGSRFTSTVTRSSYHTMTTSGNDSQQQQDEDGSRLHDGDRIMSEDE